MMAISRSDLQSPAFLFGNVGVAALDIYNCTALESDNRCAIIVAKIILLVPSDYDQQCPTRNCQHPATCVLLQTSSRIFQCVPMAETNGQEMARIPTATFI